MAKRPPSIIGQNLRFLRRRKDLTQQALADKLGLNRANIGAYEENRSSPRNDTLQLLADFFEISLDVFVREDLSKLSEEEFAAHYQWSRTTQWQRKLRTLPIILDQQNRENILFIPQRASAGYLNGFADREYIEEQPRFYLPMLGSGTYRAFEINGDSMLPLPSGTVVIGEYVENWQDIKDGQTYVVISDSEGIVYKRVYQNANMAGELLLKSDNEAYSPYSVKLEDVREVWKAKMFMSSEFPDPNMSLERLSAIVRNMQKQIGDTPSF